MQLQINLTQYFNQRGEEIVAKEHTHAFDFKSWLEGMGVNLSRAFVRRDGTDVPHSFLLKRRRDLTATEAHQARQGECAEEHHDHDVFCFTKRFMHTPQNQAPLLVLPPTRQTLLRST